MGGGSRSEIRTVVVRGDVEDVGDERQERREVRRVGVAIVADQLGPAFGLGPVPWIGER